MHKSFTNFSIESGGDVGLSDILIRVGSCIRQMRKVRHWTMSDLADRMVSLGDDVNARMIGAWERGENEITSTHIVYLSAALECSISTLLNFDPYIIPDENALLD